MVEELKHHPASLLFPLYSDKEADHLAKSIRKEGLRDPIVLCEGMVLDGRSRLVACRKAGVKPTFTNYEGDDPATFVVKQNIPLRNLSPSQKALLASRLAAIYREQAKQRRKQAGAIVKPKKGTGLKADALAALTSACEVVGVSSTAVQYANKLLKYGTPELIAKVEEGVTAVSTASRMSTWTPDKQREFAKNAQGRLDTRTADYEPIPPLGANETNGKPIGKGVRFANEAVDCLKRIPKNDALRKRGFQIVMDFIKRNK
jgi:hypothetical protein